MKIIIRIEKTKYVIGYRLALLLLGILLALSPGCSNKQGDKENKQPLRHESAEQVIEKTGVIESGDNTDPNHSGLLYDAYAITAKFGDKVASKVTTTDFIPLLKLVEVATGAPLAEWDSQYSPGEGLTYTIAGPGEYEVRVYAKKTGTGNYSLQIFIK